MMKELEEMPSRERNDAVIHNVADLGHTASFKHYPLPETVRLRREKLRAGAGRADLWRYDRPLEGVTSMHVPPDQ